VTLTTLEALVDSSATTMITHVKKMAWMHANADQHVMDGGYTF